jgi:hypothetical protein
MKKGFRFSFLWLLLTIFGIILIVLTLTYGILQDSISNYVQPYIPQISQSIQGIPSWLFLIIALILLSALIGIVVWIQSYLRKITSDKRNEYKLNHPVEHRYLSWIIDTVGAEQATFVKPMLTLLPSKKPNKSLRQETSIKSTIQYIFRFANNFDDLIQMEIKNDAYGVIIEGDPGLGKTACLRRQALLQAMNVIGGEEELPRIPVYVVISDYRGDIPFYDFFKNKLDRSFRYSSFLSLDIDSYLSEGRLLIFLDDDSIEGRNSQSQLEEIASFAEKHKDNFFVIASRPNSWLSKFNFIHYRLNPWSRSDAYKLLSKILNKSQQTQAKNIIKQIPNAYFWLTTNPNMLRILASTVQHSKKRPKTKTELVSDFIDTMLDLEIQKRGAEIDTNYLRLFLEVAASYSLDKDKFEIPLYQLKEKSYAKTIELDIETMAPLPIVEACIGAGILEQSENSNMIFFPHSIIRDYFAGSYIGGVWELQGKLTIKAWENKWTQAAGFMLGMLDNNSAKKLIQQIRNMKGFSGSRIIIGEIIANSKIDREEPLVVDIVEQLGEELQHLHRSRLQILRVLGQLYNQKTRELFDNIFFERHHNLSWISWLSQADDTLLLREQVVLAMTSVGVKVPFAHWVVLRLTWIGVNVWKFVSIPFKINFFLFPLFAMLFEFLLTYIWIPLLLFFIYWIVDLVATKKSLLTLLQTILNNADQNSGIFIWALLLVLLIAGGFFYERINFHFIQRKSQSQLKAYLDNLRSNHQINPKDVSVALFSLQRYVNLAFERKPDEIVAYLSDITKNDDFPYDFNCQAIKELALTRDPKAVDVIDEILSELEFNQSQVSFYVARTCTAALGFINTRQSVDILARISEEPIRKIRRIAIDSLTLIGTEDAAKEVFRMIDFETGTGNYAMRSYLIIQAHLINCMLVTDSLVKHKRPDKFFYHWRLWIEDIERGMYVQYYKVISECVNSGKIEDKLIQEIDNTDNAELKDKLRRIVKYIE